MEFDERYNFDDIIENNLIEEFFNEKQAVRFVKDIEFENNDVYEDILNLLQNKGDNEIIYWLVEQEDERNVLLYLSFNHVDFYIHIEKKDKECYIEVYQPRNYDDVEDEE